MIEVFIGWPWIFFLVIYVIGIPIVIGMCFQFIMKMDDKKKKENKDKNKNGSSLIIAIIIGFLWPLILLIALGAWLNGRLLKNE